MSFSLRPPLYISSPLFRYVHPHPRPQRNQTVCQFVSDLRSTPPRGRAQERNAFQPTKAIEKAAKKQSIPPLRPEYVRVIIVKREFDPLVWYLVFTH